MSIIYELDGIEGAASDCSTPTSDDKIARLSRLAVADPTPDVPRDTIDEPSLMWTTETDQPNVADWPSGDYVMRANISAFETGDISVKWQLLRVNSSCTIQDTMGTSGSFSTTGDKTFTVNTDPSSGAAGDRFQGRVLGSNSALHQDRSYTLDIVASGPFNAEIEGPWVVGAAPPVEEILSRRRPRRRFVPAA